MTDRMEGPAGGRLFPGLKAFAGRYAGHLAVISLVLLAYHGSFSHGFLMDDFTLIEYVKNHFDPYQIFIMSYLAPGPITHFFRPMGFALYYICYVAFGLNPLGYRILAFLIFTVNALLVFEVVNKVVRRRDVSLIAAAFYLTAPAIFFDVAWICVGFFDAFSILLMLLALLSYMRYMEKPDKAYYFASLAFFILSWMARESAIILPPLIILIELYAAGPGLRRAIKAIKRAVPYIAAFLALGLALAYRLYFIIPGFISSGPYKVEMSPGVVRDNMAYYASFFFANPVILAVFIALLAAALYRAESRRAALLSAAWLVVSLVPAVILGSHPQPYYLNMALVPIALAAAAGLKCCYGRIGRAKHALTVLILLALVVSFPAGVRSQELFLGDIENISDGSISYLKSSFAAFPEDSAIYIRNADSVTIMALGYDGSAIKLSYDDAVPVYVEGVGGRAPEGIGQVYTFEYVNGSISFIGRSRPRAFS